MRLRSLNTSLIGTSETGNCSRNWFTKYRSYWPSKSSGLFTTIATVGGAMAIWLQSQCRIQILKKLGPQVFWPRPQVDSAVVLLTPDPEKAAKIENREFFHDFLRRVFTLRRKHLCGAMVTLYKGHITRPQVVELLEGLKLGENTRAEEVDVATLVELSNRMVRLIGTACLSDG